LLHTAHWCMATGGGWLLLIWSYFSMHACVQKSCRQQGHTIFWSIVTRPGTLKPKVHIIRAINISNILFRIMDIIKNTAHAKNILNSIHGGGGGAWFLL
jgi:hypothetical protein